MSTTCRTCGKEGDADARFCAHCGTALTTPAPEPVAAPPSGGAVDDDAARARLSPNILQGEDGVYRWACDVSLWTNPTILFVSLKVFSGIAIGIWLFVVMISWGREGLIASFRDVGLFPLYALAFVFVMTILSYLVYAAIMGGKYCVCFEMDDEKVRHIQAPRQFKRVQWIGRLTSIVGALRGNIGMAGQGMMLQSQQAHTTHFGDVKRVIPRKRRGLIKVSAFFSYNQIYTQPEDFDAVLAYIRARCPNAR